MRASDHHIDLYRKYYETITVQRAPSVWLPTVELIAKRVGAKTVVDYGCGMARGLSFSKKIGLVTNYDPALVGLNNAPSPGSHDMVACIHMLEHVEPGTLDDVLVHIELIATKAVFIVVSCQESTKLLPDGSPWHSFVQSPLWWHCRLAVKDNYVSQPVRNFGKEYAALWIKE